MDRIEEIRERLAGTLISLERVKCYRPDVSYLLERIDELEQEKGEREKHYASGAGDCWMKLRELERENERLGRVVSAAKRFYLGTGLVQIDHDGERRLNALGDAIVSVEVEAGRQF